MTFFTVIRVSVDGVVGYLKDEQPSCLWPEPIVSDPLLAYNFENDERAFHRALSGLVMPDDSSFAKSGLRIDGAPERVRFEAHATELSCEVAREAYK